MSTIREVHAFTKAAYDQYEQMRRKITHNIRGGGILQIHNTPDSLVLYVPPYPTPPAQRVKPDETCRVQLTGAASGGGKYEGQVMTAPDPVDLTGNLSAAEVGTAGTGAESVLVLNAREIGNTGHDLDHTRADNVFLGHFCGTTSEATPRRVVVIDGMQPDDCEEA